MRSIAIGISQRMLSGIGICIGSVSECYVLVMGSIAIGISIGIGMGIGIDINIAICICTASGSAPPWFIVLLAQWLSPTLVYCSVGTSLHHNHYFQFFINIAAGHYQPLT